MTFKKTIEIPNCGNSWCDYYVGCKGHTMTMEYSTVTDIGSLYLDGHTMKENILTGGDNLFSAIVELINANPYLESYKLVEPLEETV